MSTTPQDTATPPVSSAAAPQRDPYFHEITLNYLNKNPEFVTHLVEKDAALARYRDDPSTAVKELSSYPGVIAMAAHEKAHALYNEGKKDDARILAEAAHKETGIDIHPGTTVGKNVFIDHGAAVIIGEQAKVGEGTVMYQSSTLGAYGKTPTDSPRHPSIGKDNILSAGAQVLGHVQSGNNVTFGPSAHVFGNKVKIGSRDRFGPDDRVYDNTTVGSDNVFGAHVQLYGRTTIGNNNKFGLAVKIDTDVAIGNNVTIGRNTHIDSNVEIGDGVTIGKHVHILENTGAITQNDVPKGIPDYSLVQRDPESKELVVTPQFALREASRQTAGGVQIQ